eukprot:12027049-Ditylum_brightwellii.AAC.1
MTLRLHIFCQYQSSAAGTLNLVPQAHTPQAHYCVQCISTVSPFQARERYFLSLMQHKLLLRTNAKWFCIKSDMKKTPSFQTKRNETKYLCCSNDSRFFFRPTRSVSPETLYQKDRAQPDLSKSCRFVS